MYSFSSSIIFSLDKRKKVARMRNRMTSMLLTISYGFIPFFLSLCNKQLNGSQRKNSCNNKCLNNQYNTQHNIIQNLAKSMRCSLVKCTLLLSLKTRLNSLKSNGSVKLG